MFLHGSGRVNILAGSRENGTATTTTTTTTLTVIVDQECLAIGSGSQSVGGELIVERWE
jgi:hypothetical protein